MVTTAPQLLRKDAARNREAIMNAARELFAESDDVPMYEIGKRAGVGQATLYRNFPERSAIVAALLSEVVDRLEELAGRLAGDPDAFFVLLRHMIETQVRFHGLGYGLRDATTGQPELEPLRQRLAKLLRRPLRDAKVAGRIRPDITIRDVFLVASMVEGALAKVPSPSGKAGAAARALKLIVDGLSP